jgi:chemotaxis signal transduction protein
VNREPRESGSAAAPLPRSGGPAAGGAVVVFRVAGDRYALPLEVVARVLPSGAETATRADDGGREIARLSARACLGYDEATADAETHGILLRLDEGEAVLSVDQVDGVSELDAAGVTPAPAVFAGRTAELLRGVARAPEGGLILLLNPQALRLKDRDGEDGASDATSMEGS